MPQVSVCLKATTAVKTVKTHVERIFLNNTGLALGSAGLTDDWICFSKTTPQKLYAAVRHEVSCGSWS